MLSISLLTKQALNSSWPRTLQVATNHHLFSQTQSQSRNRLSSVQTPVCAFVHNTTNNSSNSSRKTSASRRRKPATEEAAQTGPVAPLCTPNPSGTKQLRAQAIRAVRPLREDQRAKRPQAKEQKIEKEFGLNSENEVETSQSKPEAFESLVDSVTSTRVKYNQNKNQMSTAPSATLGAKAGEAEQNAAPQPAQSAPTPTTTAASVQEATNQSINVASNAKANAPPSTIDARDRKRSDLHNLTNLNNRKKFLTPAQRRAQMQRQVFDQSRHYEPGNAERGAQRLPADAIADWEETRRPRVGAKRKVFLLFGYNGRDFQGLQTQNDPIKCWAVEDALLKALHVARCISDDNISLPQRFQLMRAARTDKGVHAACNVISLNLVEPSDQTKEELIATINENLPPTVRVFDYELTTNNFQAKISCSHRSYEYVMPSYAFDPQLQLQPWIEPEGYQDQMAAQNAAREQEAKSANATAASVSADASAQSQSGHKRKRADSADSDEDQQQGNEEEANDPEQASQYKDKLTGLPGQAPMTEELKAKLRSFRLSPERVAQVNDAMSHFVGTKNYYNFTRHRQIKDAVDKPKYAVARQAYFDALSPADQQQELARIEAAAQAHKRFDTPRHTRHVMSARITSTFVEKESGMEFVKLQIDGQSFMFNQIRKMIGLLVCHLGTKAYPAFSSQKVWARVFTEPDLYTPIAPALGLLLLRPHFELYDTKQVWLNEQPHATKRTLYKDAAARTQPQVDEFAHKAIYPTITLVEAQAMNFYQWMCYQPNVLPESHPLLVEHQNKVAPTAQPGSGAQSTQGQAVAIKVESKDDSKQQQAAQN